MAELQPNEVVLTNVRLSFPDLWEARASVEGSEPKFSAAFLVDPAANKKDIRAIEAAKKWCEDDHFKGKAPVYKDNRCCFMDGDDCTNSKTGEPYNGYEGMKVVKAATKKRPKVLNRAKDPVAEGDDQAPYAGCYVDAVVRFYCVSGKDKGGNGFFAELVAVRFRRDGEAFGSSIDVDSAFEDLDDDDLV